MRVNIYSQLYNKHKIYAIIICLNVLSGKIKGQVKGILMKINSVLSTNVPKIFASIYPKKYTGLGVETKEEKQRKVGTIYALSIAGIASAALVVGARNGITPKSIFQNTSKKIAEAYRKKHPPKDPLVELLGNRRDSQALKDYENFMIKKKNTSLLNKIVAGDFNRKSGIDFDKILKNNENMQRQIRSYSATV